MMDYEISANSHYFLSAAMIMNCSYVRSPSLTSVLSLYGRLQGVNTLVVALASRGITLLSSLLEELQVEGLLTDTEDEQAGVGTDFSVNSRCSAWRRVKKLMDDLPLLNYLLAQFSTLYKMVRLLQLTIP